jgi:hypothetical protein
MRLKGIFMQLEARIGGSHYKMAPPRGRRQR